MKLLIPLLFIGFSFLGHTQTLWNELPELPTSPSAGQVGTKSNDFMISEDGRMYAAYLYDNGGGNQLYVKEWDGSNWNIAYQDFAYSGFESIHSFSIGTDIYFMCKIDNASLTDMLRVYKISNGSVGIVTSLLFNDMLDEADYKFLVAEAGDFGYMLHYDSEGVYVILTQINLGTGATADLTVTPGYGSNLTYDMVEHGGIVYVATNISFATIDTYMYKVSSSMAALDPIMPAYTDGLLPNTTVPSDQQLMMGYNEVSNTIQLTVRGNGTNKRFEYNPTGPTMNAFTANSVADYATPTVSRSTPEGIFYFNNFTNGMGSSPATEILMQDLNTNVLSPVGTFPYNTLGADAVNHKMNACSSNKRIVTEVYDIDMSRIRHFVSNEVPTLDLSSYIGAACPNQNSTIFQHIGLSDPNFDNLTILGITSNNQSAIADGGITYQYLYSSGGVDFFNISATAGASGAFALTMEVTDGYDTTMLTLPALTIMTVVPPVFNVGAIHLCSGNGLVDLSGYVSPAGGTFNIGGASGMFNGTSIDSDNSGLTPENATFIYYTIPYNGCAVSEAANIVLHESATVSITTTPTTCGASSGSAVANIAGGTAPFLVQAWSSGETSVTSANNLAAGVYTFTLVDAYSCMVTTEFNIVPNGVDILPTITNVACNGQNNGSISANLVGFTAPVTMLWSSGHAGTIADDLYAGTYSLLVQDANNCIYNETFTVTEPQPLAATATMVQPACGVSNGSISVGVITGGTTPYSQIWSTGSTSSTVGSIPAGVYSLTVTDFAGCQTIVPVYLSDQNSANLTGTVIGSNCGADDGGINVTPFLPAGEQIQSIDWSNGATTEDIYSLAPALYICTLATNNNCKAFKGWNIPVVQPLQQPICVITVDSTTSTNLVVWEDVQPTGIAYYNIYRETSNQGEYILIDTVEATNISLFNDVVASPIFRSWSYKISAVNACNVEGPLSLPHRTMHLSAIANGSSQTDVSWNAYEGTNYSSFVLWRYTFANGWVEAATLPTTQTTYTDGTAFATPGLDYMVELSLDEQCSALVYRAQDFNTTRSNKDKGAFSAGNGTGDSNNGIEDWLLDQVKVYPNPTNGIVTIEQSRPESLTIIVSDLAGKTLFETTETTLETMINLNQFESGIYLIQYELNNVRRTQHIVKQ